MLRVLIADDSATARELLIEIVFMDPQMEVCGVATNGSEAVAMTKAQRPDIILMDIEMPGLNGFQATKIIMEEQPTPIIIVSGHGAASEVSGAMEALRAGALSILPKPSGAGSPRFHKDAEHLLSALRTMSKVAVRQSRPRPDLPVARAPVPPAATMSRRVELVVVTASTGGPAALSQILAALPATCTTPIVVVQHLPPGFVAGLRDELSQLSLLRVKVAHHLARLEPKTVYLAASGRHLVVRDRTTLGLVQQRESDQLCPSADALFTSAAQVFGAATVALVLTGTGTDGLEGCRAVKAAGGLVAAQDEQSSVIFGMPMSAIKAGVAQHILSLHDIARWLINLTASPT